MRRVTVNLYALMAKHKIRTVTEVAAATNISSKALYKIINDQTRRIDFETISKLCNFFDCEISDLMILEEKSVS